MIFIFLNQKWNFYINNYLIIYYKFNIFENRKDIYRAHLNGIINKGITEVNYELIRTTLVDYDLNQKRITKTLLKNETNLSLSTIKNYLNKYSELNEIYQLVKNNSGTVKQIKQREYNLNKKKVA